MAPAAPRWQVVAAGARQMPQRPKLARLPAPHPHSSPCPTPPTRHTPASARVTHPRTQRQNSPHRRVGWVRCVGSAAHPVRSQEAGGRVSPVMALGGSRGGANFGFGGAATRCHLLPTRTNPPSLPPPAASRKYGRDHPARPPLAGRRPAGAVPGSRSGLLHRGRGRSHRRRPGRRRRRRGAADRGSQPAPRLSTAVAAVQLERVHQDLRLELRRPQPSRAPHAQPVPQPQQRVAVAGPAAPERGPGVGGEEAEAGVYRGGEGRAPARPRGRGRRGGGDGDGLDERGQRGDS